MLCAGLFTAHFVHLRADFPNHSRWREWAKYTDEGWYGNAAVRAVIRRGPVAASFVPAPGTPAWHLDGDFNPAVALPVWPLLLAGVFHFTGPGIAAARALSVATLGVDCCLLFLLMYRLARSPWAALFAVTMALSSMYWFVFDRLAILEPLATAFLLAALLLTLHLRSREGPRSTPLILLGLLCCLLLLTKTTGVFLLPGIFLLLRPEGTWREIRARWLRDAAIAGCALAVSYGGYFLLVWRAGYAVDFRYLFTANIYPHPVTLAGWIEDGYATLHGALCMGYVLPWTAVGVTALRSMLRGRLPAFDGAVWLGTGIYLFFIFLHDNPQPRYYMPLALLFIVVAITGACALLRERGMYRRAGAAALLLLGAASLSGATEMVNYLRHPQYTLLHAAQALTAYIDTHPNGNRVLLGTSGDEISLMTGLPAICDDYGPWELPDRIARYQPGWFETWNDIDYGALQDIHTHDWLERAATFPATDDPDRNVLILYRLHPLPGEDVGVPEGEEEP